MREILFRGKTPSGEWVYGGYYFENDKHFIIKSVRYKPDTRDWDTADYYENNPTYRKEFVEVIPESIGQFTGLTDKNGKKIFESDIVIYNRSRKLPNTKPRPQAIFFDERNVQFTRYVSPYATLQKDKMSECEVIGNIHDNPELLKSEVKAE